MAYSKNVFIKWLTIVINSSLLTISVLPHLFFLYGVLNDLLYTINHSEFYLVMLIIFNLINYLLLNRNIFGSLSLMFSIVLSTATYFYIDSFSILTIILVIIHAATSILLCCVYIKHAKKRNISIVLIIYMFVLSILLLLLVSSHLSNPIKDYYYESPNRKLEAIISTGNDFGTRVDSVVMIRENTNHQLLFGRYQKSPMIEYCDFWHDPLKTDITWLSNTEFQFADHIIKIAE